VVEATQRESGTTLRDYLRVVRRRKWIIVMAVVLVPAGAVAFSLQQQKLYRASADVLLNQQNLGTQLNGIPDPTVYQQPDRKAQTQADLAGGPAVARRAIADAGLAGLRPTVELLSSSSVTAKQNADLLHFAVTDSNPTFAVRLVNAYANAYIRYRAQLETGALVQAKRDVTARLDQLKSGTAAYEALVEKGNTLDTMIALASKPAFLVDPATDAAQVQPRPLRNGILGGVLGLVLGVALAFLWEALDTRVRSADEVAERLGIPLLARLPEPPRKLRAKNRLAMLVEPNGIGGEAFRTLRTNLDFVALNGSPKTIMVTSAIQAEGKSTTVANLALASARTGKDVVLVDLDLRRPYIHRFFPFEDRPGITEVALGYADLDDAILNVAFGGLTADAPARNGNGNGNGHRKVEVILDAISAGPLPPNGGDFIASEALGEILARLRVRYDLVLIDAPPLLRVGDGIALSARVDAMIVVTRLNILRRPMLNELRRVLHTLPAQQLGFVVTGAHLDDGYTYGYGGYYQYDRRTAERQSAGVTR
jgi:Mrp family chromosome partitioning ATPase/capsular polysaccharide biosynthesis protein